MDELFSVELPDLQGFIRQLDMLDNGVNKAVRTAMHKGAEVICAEQKRLAGAISQRLADEISTSSVYVTKKGYIGITSGYQADAFRRDVDEDDEDGFNPGIVGTMYEFGRPGQSPARKDKYMYQTRKRRADRNSPAVLKRVKISKGNIAARPHIRPGFDRKIGQAVETVINSATDEIRKVYNE